MALINKIKRKFNGWVYTLWNKLGDKHNWHTTRIRTQQQFKKIEAKKRHIKHNQNLERMRKFSNRPLQRNNKKNKK